MNREMSSDLIEASEAQSSTVSPPPLPPTCHNPLDLAVQSGAPPVIQSTLVGDDVVGSLKNDSLVQLEIVPRRPQKKASTGLISSLGLHAVIIVLLALLLAPADFGGADLMQLYVTLSNEEATDSIPQTVPFEVVAVENEVEPSEAIDLPPANPAPINAPTVADSRGGGDSVAGGGGRASSGGSASGGSFFGIEATGHDFVYVLDMSGSMRGRRFSRATAELERSVNGLLETQEFYVLLFDSSTVQMFGDSEFSPTPVAATPENKLKLSRWLYNVYRGGGTDPRDALRTALRMNPSAIFMLSDGEFDDQRKRKRKSSLLSGDSDVFAIVAAASSKVPIHAIALEDPTSCANMKRLSDMTQGEYRFAEVPDDKNAAIESLALSREAARGGDKLMAEQLLRHTATSFGNTQSGREARQELAVILSDAAEDGITLGKLDVTHEALMEIVKMDPQAIDTAEIQTRLVDRLLHQSSQVTASDTTAGLSLLEQLVDRYPDSVAAIAIVSPVADRLLDVARKFNEKSDPVQSIMKMEEILTKYPQTNAAVDGRIEQRQTVEKLLAQAKKLRRTKNDAVCARTLQELTVAVQGTQVESVFACELEELVIELLTTARDATLQRDYVARDEANRQLSVGLGESETLERIRHEFTRRELNAQNLIRRGNRLENVADADGALGLYNSVVRDFPGTLAATKAQMRLRNLQPEPVAPKVMIDNEYATLIEIMQQ